MVKDAEAHSAEDKKRREVVEAKNHAEGLIHSTEKSLAEYGSKVSAADKSAIESAVADLKGVLESGDAEAIKSRTQALAEAAMKLGEAMYAASQAGAEAQPGTQGDDVVDADFEEVKDDKKSA
jgi:molecular chaperone DnaK